MSRDSNDGAREVIPGATVNDLLERGDQEALGELLEWYRPLMKAIVDRELDPILRVKADSSDIIQQTCQDAIISFDSLRARTEPQFLAWLKTLLVHNVVDLQRQYIGARKRSLRLEKRLSESRLSADDIAASDDNPASALQHAERLKRLVAALQKLPPELRRILRWRFRKQMSYKDIGEKVGRKEDAVRMFVQRLLVSLREQVFSNDSSL